MSTKTQTKLTLTPNTKKWIIIGAIILAAVITISITLAVLLKPAIRTPDDENPDNKPSSNLTIKNGDFALVSSDDTNFPKTAENWDRYAYKAPASSSATQEFETITTRDDVVMGIVDTDNEDGNWDNALEQLNFEGVTGTIANPGLYAEDLSNTNVYMMATKKATTASIMTKDSISIAPLTSVKITIRLYTGQIKNGSATIMVQKSTLNADESNRYAYEYSIDNKEEWQTLELYVFNRQSSTTAYIRVNVGIGNVYTGATAEGVLFVDDVMMETVTANEYRIYADKDDTSDTTYKIIEKEDESNKAEQSKYLTLSDYNTDGTAAAKLAYTKENYNTEAESSYVKQYEYAPFTMRDDFVNDDFGIYQLSHQGNVIAGDKNIFALRLTQNINVSTATSDETQDHHHISFWIRTLKRNALAEANIVVQKKLADGTYEDLSGGNYKFETSQEIKTDTNNGWTKCDIYLRPSQTPEEIRIIFALGNITGYEGQKAAPDGDLFITTPYWETISRSAYDSASSSGTASKKFDLKGSSADPTVSNGSFSNLVATTSQPTSWEPAFAGQNVIYKDGRGNEVIDNLVTTADAINGSGANIYSDTAYTDDDERRVLEIKNNVATAYGYVSSNITLDAKTVYVFSVLAKAADGQRPYFYLLDTNKELTRDQMVLAQASTAKEINGDLFNQDDETYKDTGFKRYYIVFANGAESKTVKLALFNGSIDGAELNQGTVYYDKVSQQTIGKYSLVEDKDNEETYKVEYTAEKGYLEADDVEKLVEKLETEGVIVVQPTAEEWTEMRKVPDEEDKKDDDGDDTAPVKKDVDLGLLFSILSSVILVAALAVVLVIKAFKKRNRQ